MAANATTHDHSIASDHDSQASGRSIFWALATVVLSAMLQPSFSGSFTNDNLFQDTLWPHRSSPIVCLIDFGVDLWIIVDKRRRPDSYRQSSEHAKPTAVAMRLAIFVLGVLPQSIKLFSMQGIPVVQAIAAVFLVSLLASMARTIHLESPQKDIDDLIKRIKARDTFSTPGRRNVFTQPVCALHAGGAYHVWRTISNQTTIPVSSDIRDAARWVETALISSTFIYVQQHMIFTIVRGLGKWILPRWPMPVLVQVFSTPALLHLLREPQDRPLKWNLPFALVVHVGLCCYAVALAIQRIARKLLRSSLEESSSEPAPANLELTVAGRTFDISGSSSTVEMTGTAFEGSRPAEGEAPPAYESGNTSSSMRDPPPAYSSSNTVSPAEEAENPVQSTGSTFENSDDLHWSLKIFFGYPIVASILILSYAELFDLRSADEEVHNSSERGEQAAPDPSAADDESMKITSRIRFAANKVCKRLLNALLKLLGRTFIAGVSLFVYSVKWLEQKMRSHPEGTVWVAFGLFNFVTAMVYFLVAFDGRDTYSPQWTSVLG